MARRNFDFSEALRRLKLGARVTREGWLTRGLFLYLVPGSSFEVTRAPLLGIYPEGTTVEYVPHIDVGSRLVPPPGHGPWAPTMEDILADDWELAG